MKEQSVFRERFYPIIFMFLITAVFIAVISSIYLTTQDRVELNESLYLKEAVLFAADIEIPETAEEIDKVYSNRIEEVKEGAGATPDYVKILGPAGDQVTGYALFVRGPGLWGEIRGVLAVEQDLETIRGIDFISQNETPGLGARITEKWFREQFRGKSLPLNLVPEETAEGPDEIDAITGASKTSKAVMDIVRKSMENVRSKVKG